MKANPKLIEALNEILSGELTAVNQYFIHAKMCDNWGFKRIAEINRKASIDEMKHADRLIERILQLEGVPAMRLGKVKVGEKVMEQLKLDRDLEREAISRLNNTIALAVELSDNATREGLEDMLTSEEEHVHWIETQIELVKQIGEANYLTLQVHS